MAETSIGMVGHCLKVLVRNYQSKRKFEQGSIFFRRRLAVGKNIADDFGFVLAAF
jgi:hypothetical protein